MTADPCPEPEDASSTADTPPECSDVFSVDFYGVKARVPISPDDVSEKQEQPPQQKSFAEIGREVVGYLKIIAIKPFECLANVVELGAELPKQCTRLTRAAGSMSESCAALLRRCAKGRARADHAQDQRIAEIESDPPPADSTEFVCDRRDAAIQRLEDLRRRFVEKNGYELPIVENEDGSVLIPAVPPDQQQLAVAEMQAKLREVQSLAGPRLDSIGLPMRITIALAKAGIHTTEQLKEYSVSEIRKVHGIGKASVGILAPYLKP